MTLKRQDIRIRDPFIYTDRENSCYYMYGTGSLIDGTINTGNKFWVYKSYDLENFEGPITIFDGDEENFWADRDYWAPELHRYNGKYYLFASLKAEGRNRATQIFVSNTPDGKFAPLSDAPITPKEWMCLDGTFFIEDGVPYMVFCHEWVQVGDGEIWAVPLTDDLTSPAGEPKMLFRASDDPEVTPHGGRSGDYVTDGPFLRHEDGKVKMIWSSFCNGRYAVLEAEADTLFGEWRHSGSRFAFDGGHAMIFETLDGERKLALHSPNTCDLERAEFYEF